MNNHILVLWINGCQLFRKFVSDETHHKSVGSGWTAVNEVLRCIFYILMINLFSCTNGCIIYCVWYKVLGSCQVPDERICFGFLHNAFYIGYT